MLRVKVRAFPRLKYKTIILDHKTNKRIEGIVGNNFSSYVRDYDFSILLLGHNKNMDRFSVPEGFGDCTASYLNTL